MHYKKEQVSRRIVCRKLFQGNCSGRDDQNGEVHEGQGCHKEGQVNQIQRYCQCTLLRCNFPCLPVVYSFAVQGDVRRCALAGLMPEMVLYAVTHVFESMQAARETAVVPTGAGNVTTAYIITDLHGLNARQGACLACKVAFVI